MIERQSWPVRWKTIINRIRVIHSTGEEQKLLEELSACEEPVVVGFVNAHAMNSLTSNDDFLEPCHRPLSCCVMDRECRCSIVHAIWRQV